MRHCLAAALVLVLFGGDTTEDDDKEADSWSKTFDNVPAPLKLCEADDRGWLPRAREIDVADGFRID